VTAATSLPDAARRAAWVEEARAARGVRAKKRRAGWTGYFFVLPAFAIFATFVIRPLLQTFWLSFYSWDGLSPRKWVGFANYRELFSDPELRSAFFHSGVLVVFISIFPVALGLFLAAVLSRGRIRGLTVFRTLLFFPRCSPWWWSE